MQQPGQTGGPAAANTDEIVLQHQMQLQQAAAHQQQQLHLQQQYYYNKHFFPKYPQNHVRGPMITGLYGSEPGSQPSSCFAYSGPALNGFIGKDKPSPYPNDSIRSPYTDEVRRQKQQMTRSPLPSRTPKEYNASAGAVPPEDLTSASAAALYFNKNIALAALKQQHQLQAQQQQEFLMAAAAAAAQYQQRLMLAGVTGGGAALNPPPPWFMAPPPQGCPPITPYQLPHPFFGLPPFAPPLISSVVAAPLPTSSVVPCCSVVGTQHSSAPTSSQARMALAPRDPSQNSGQHNPSLDTKFNPDNSGAANQLSNLPFKRLQSNADPPYTNNATKGSGNSARRLCNDEGLALKAKAPGGCPASQEFPYYGSTLPYPNVTNPYYHLTPNHAQLAALNSSLGNAYHPITNNNGNDNKAVTPNEYPTASQIEFLRCLGVPSAYINSLDASSRDYYTAPLGSKPQPLQARIQAGAQRPKTPVLASSKKPGPAVALSPLNSTDPTFNPFALIKSRIISDIRTLDSCIETLEHKLETLAQNKNEISRELNYRFTKISPESAVHKSLVQCGKDLGELEKRGDLIEDAWVWKDVLKRNQETATGASSATTLDLTSDTLVEPVGRDPPSRVFLEQLLTPDPCRDSKVKVVLGLIKTQLGRERRAFHERYREFREKYQQKMDSWKESVAKSKKLAKRRNKDAKVREFFENQFPELRDDRMEKERLKRIWTRNTMGNYARTETDVEEISKRLHEQEEEKKRLYRLSATIPRLLTSTERDAERRCYYVDPHRVVGAGPKTLDTLEPTLDTLEPALERSSPAKAPNFAGFNDPLTERAIMLKYVNLWTAEEREIFKKIYVSNPKEFGLISRHLPNKSTADCVLHYYMTKKEENYKKLIKKKAVKKRKITSKSQQNNVNCNSTNSCNVSNKKILGQTILKSDSSPNPTALPNPTDPLQDSSDDALLEIVEKPTPTKSQTSFLTTPPAPKNENVSQETLENNGTPTCQPLAISTPKEAVKNCESPPSPPPNLTPPVKTASPKPDPAKQLRLAAAGRSTPQRDLFNSSPPPVCLGPDLTDGRKRPSSEPRILLATPDPSPPYDPYDFGTTEQPVDLSSHTACAGQPYRDNSRPTQHVVEQGIKRRVENDVSSVDGDENRKGELSNHERYKRFRFNDCQTNPPSSSVTGTQANSSTTNQPQDRKQPSLNRLLTRFGKTINTNSDEERVAAQEAFLSALPKDDEHEQDSMSCVEDSSSYRHRLRQLPTTQDLLGAVIRHQINQTVDGADSIKLWNPLRRFTQSPTSSYSSNNPSLSPTSTARGDTNTIPCEPLTQPPPGPANAPSVSS